MGIVVCSLAIFFVVVFFTIFVNVAAKLENTEERAFKDLIKIIDKNKGKDKKKKHSRNKYKSFTSK